MTTSQCGDVLDKHFAHDRSDSDVESQPTETATEKPSQRPPMASRMESVYPPSGQVLAVMISLMLAVFLVSLDKTIVATAIPKITDDFHALDDIGWYGSAYLLTNSCFQLLLGRIYTFNSPKVVFIIMIIIFEIGSALCGAAPNSISFIIGRAISGLGAAGIMNGGIVLMVLTVPLAKRPVYQGMFGAVSGLSSVVGPLLGGALTTGASWRWCFYINLPMSGVALAVICLFLPRFPAQQCGLTLRRRLAKLDLLGQLFLLPSIVCLLLALQWGGSTYPWHNGRIIALLTCSMVLAIAFALVQIFRQETATIPASIVCNRSMLAAIWFVFCLASAMMIIVYFVPIWFQAVEGQSAVQSGIRTIPLVLSLVVGASSAGWAVGRVGYYTPFALLSAVIVPVGAGLITTWRVDTKAGAWIGFQIVFGLGLGVGLQQAGMAAQTVLAKTDVPTGIAMTFFSQLLGGAIFISVGQSVFDTKLVAELVRLVPGLSPADVVNTGATELRTIVPPQQLEQVVQAYNNATRQVFLVGTAVGALAIIGALGLEWRSVKRKGSQQVIAGEALEK